MPARFMPKAAAGEPWWGLAAIEHRIGWKVFFGNSASGAVAVPVKRALKTAAQGHCGYLCRMPIWWHVTSNPGWPDKVEFC